MNERNPYESDDTVDIPDFSSIKVNDDDIDRSVFKMNDDIPSYNEPEYDDEEDYFSIGKEWAFADTMVSGEDLVRFIGKYPNQYNIVILRTTESDIKYDKLRKEDSIEKWSMSYNMEVRGIVMSRNEYKLTVIKNK